MTPLQQYRALRGMKIIRPEPFARLRATAGEGTPPPPPPPSPDLNPYTDIGGAGIGYWWGLLIFALMVALLFTVAYMVSIGCDPLGCHR